MAITSGAGPHAAWLTVNGQKFSIESGSVDLIAKRQTSTFRCSLPLSAKGAEETFSELGDNDATITVLSRGAVTTLLSGEVDTAKFDYIARTISISGRDKSAKLHNKKTNEKFLNKKPHEIVKELVSRAGLGTGKIADSTIMAGKKLEKDFVHLTDNVSYAHAIHKLAQVDGAKWWIDAHGLFHYQQFGTTDNSYLISIKQDSVPISSDCMHLSISRNVQAGKPQKTTIKAWHPRKKQIFGYTSTVEGKGTPVEYNYHVPTLETDTVKKRAQAQSTERARNELKVHATVVGDPSVMAGMGLTMSGTRHFDQTFEIDTVNHQFGMQGFLTSITARSAKTGRKAS